MKILHIISSGGMYGAEAVILNLSRTLNESGHTSVLGVFANSKNLNLQLYEKAAAEGIESHLIPCSAQIDRAAMTSLRELVIRTRADVIHAHGFKADIYAYFALRRFTVPLVSTCHNWTDTDPVVSFYGRADRFILRRYDAVIAVSEAVKQRLLKAGVREDRIYIIKNGIDLRPFKDAAPSLRGDGEDIPMVGFVGRLSKEKGADVFLRVASRVVAEIPHAKFVIVGDGPEREELKALINQLGIRRSVSLVGRRNDMPSVYASFDLMILSSHDEGLPMAILEGMASRLPWIATAVGDVPQVIQHGNSGVLVPPGDVDALAANVIALLGDSPERRRLGDAARRRVEEVFSAERMTATYLDVYRRVLTDTNLKADQEKNYSATQGKA
jgi:glycosyltransferase involved in cell wall biosynthesis